MNRLLCSLLSPLVVCFGLFATSAQAQIPTTDLASLAQQIQQVQAWGQQAASMKTQISTLQNQLQSQKQLFESLNGSRGIGMLLNNSALKSALPADWQKVYSTVQSGGYAGLTGSAKAIRDANKIYSCNQVNSVERTACDRELSKAAQDKAFSQDAYASSEKRLDNIQMLMRQIDATGDPKAASDLQSRMAAENAMIQNEQTKLMMFKMMAEAEDKLIAQQKHETDMKNQGRKTRVQSTLQPLQF